MILIAQYSNHHNNKIAKECERAIHRKINIFKIYLVVIKLMKYKITFLPCKLETTKIIYRVLEKGYQTRTHLDRPCGEKLCVTLSVKHSLPKNIHLLWLNTLLGTHVERGQKLQYDLFKNPNVLQKNLFKKAMNLYRDAIKMSMMYSFPLKNYT